MRSAAMEPFEPGFVAEGLSRLFPLSAQVDEHAMQALGSLVGYLFRAAGLKVD
jgi:hypothetical protein